MLLYYHLGYKMKRYCAQLWSTSKLDLQQAASELEQGKEAVRVHQKHIWITDWSDWGVVAEYEAEKSADESDN